MKPQRTPSNFKHVTIIRTGWQTNESSSKTSSSRWRQNWPPQTFLITTGKMAQ